MVDSNISDATAKRLLKTQTQKRVSQDAGRELKKDIEERGEEIVEKAVELAEHQDRVTVRAVDVRKAIMELEK